MYRNSEIQNIQSKVDALNFDRIKFKMEQDKCSPFNDGTLATAEREYRRFLCLVGMFPNKNLVPTKLVDEFWHQHILDTKAYREDCQEVFGVFIEHFPYFGIHGKQDAINLDTAFEETKDLYRKVFNDEIPHMMSSRCAGHACHVPSECACRVPGACKSN